MSKHDCLDMMFRLDLRCEVEDKGNVSRVLSDHDKWPKLI